MSLRAVFFDLDGTLLDTAGDLARALNCVLAREGRAPLPFDAIRRVVSDGAYAMLELGFGLKREHPEMARLREALLQSYLCDIAGTTVVFAGLNETIAALAEHDIPWGIVTNKPEAYAVPLMRHFQFASAPVCLVCPEHVRQRKPHPEPLLLACAQANCAPHEAIYVGDHARDIESGQGAGMPTIAANYGYIHHEDSAHRWGATHVVESGHELWPILASYL